MQAGLAGYFLPVAALTEEMERYRTNYQARTRK